MSEEDDGLKALVWLKSTTHLPANISGNRSDPEHEADSKDGAFCPIRGNAASAEPELFFNWFLLKNMSQSIGHIPEASNSKKSHGFTAFSIALRMTMLLPVAPLTASTFVVCFAMTSPTIDSAALPFPQSCRVIFMSVIA